MAGHPTPGQTFSCKQFVTSSAGAAHGRDWERKRCGKQEGRAICAIARKNIRSAKNAKDAKKECPCKTCPPSRSWRPSRTNGSFRGHGLTALGQGSSFPRRRESSVFDALWCRSHWIPAFAGMTKIGDRCEPSATGVWSAPAQASCFLCHRIITPHRRAGRGLFLPAARRWPVAAARPRRRRVRCGRGIGAAGAGGAGPNRGG